MTATKKRNPADKTERNLKPLRRRLDKLEAFVREYGPTLKRLKKSLEK